VCISYILLENTKHKYYVVVCRIFLNEVLVSLTGCRCVLGLILPRVDSDFNLIFIWHDKEPMVNSETEIITKSVQCLLKHVTRNDKCS
jgi:hypothetical protein